MAFSYVVSGGSVAAASTTPTTQGPGQVITIYGGPNATADIPGPHNDPADLYGIVLVFIGIFAAIALSRWLFGRNGKRPGGRPA